MATRIRYDDDDAVDHPWYERFATIVAGAPGRCPECDAFGYIDHLDLGNQVQNQHCRVCGYFWEYHFDAEGRISEVRELSAPDRRPVVLGAGASEVSDTVVDLRSAPAPARKRNEPLRAPVSRR